MENETFDEPTDVGDTGDNSSGEDSSASAKSQTVPLSRFNEIYKELKQTKDDITALKNQKQEGSLSPEQTKELQAKQYLKGLLEETLTEKKKEEAEVAEKEQKEFEKNVHEVLSVYTDVKEDEFLKFMETKASKYGITSVSGAMELYREMNSLTKETEKRTKDNLAKKPNLPRSEANKNSGELPDDSHKTLSQIAEEAASQLD